MRAECHGGKRQRVPIEQVELVQSGNQRQLFDALALGEALERLETIAPEQCTVATMRFLFGCSVDETATTLGVSAAKVKKDWAFARAWLQRELRRGEPDDD